MTLLVHDNQSFSLTTGQPTPTTQKGATSKAKPQGEENNPFNPIKLALASGATFIARCNARDVTHTTEILIKAINHKGFSFVEIIQDCLIFNIEANNKDKPMYKISDCHNLDRAEKFASEWNYNSKTGKIPLGVIYQNENSLSLAEKWPILKKKLK
jgi:2-oxoglutarate ferredoxin oxidoreductase subunit beta